MRFSILILLATACGDVNPLDVDAPPDLTSKDAPTDTSPAPRRPGMLASTSGGGVTISAGYRLRVRVGGSQPAGRTASTNHHLSTGPGALP